MKSRVLAVVAALALTIGSLAAGAAPAQAASNGKVTGVLTVGTQAIEGATVDLYPWGDGANHETTTGADGTFSFVSLPLGHYSLQVDSTHDSQPISVDFSLTSTKPTKTLVLSALGWATGASSISGDVTSAGAPLSGVSVDFYPLRDDVEYQTLETDAAGHWSVGSLPSGEYGIRYSRSGYQDKFFDLTLGSHQDLDASATMSTRTAFISGDVTDGAGHAPDYAFVDIVSDDPTDDIDSPEVEANGHYSINLAPGGYTVSTGGPWGSIALDSHHVTVAAGDHVTVDLVAIEPATATISGKVTTASGAGISGICVDAYSTEDADGSGSEELTGTSGTFTITDVAPGDYSLGFTDCSSRTTKYARVFEGGGVAFSAPEVVAKRIHVEAGDAISGRIQKLAPGATISGTVTVQAADGAATLPAGHYPVDRLYAFVNGAWTDKTIYSNRYGAWPTGSYGIGGVAAGTYRLGISDNSTGGAPYPDRFYSGAATVADATDIVVASGKNRTGINVTMTVPQPGTDPVAVDEAALTAAKQNMVTAGATAKQGQLVSIGVGKSHVGEWVSVWMRSDATALTGWARVTKAGTVLVTIPAATLSGTHKLIVQSSDDGVIGWRNITIAGGAYPSTEPGDLLVDDSVLPLHASIDAYPAGTKVAWQWYRTTSLASNGTAIPMATKPDYAPTSADASYLLHVRAAVTVPGYGVTYRYSDALDYSLHQTGVVAITGEIKTGSPLTADVSGLTFVDRDGTPATDLGYQWYSNGVKISGATLDTFTPSGAYSGKRLTVTVTAKLAGRIPKSTTSAATGALGALAFDHANDPLPELVLDPATNTLSVASLGMEPLPAGTKVTYVWYRDNPVVPGQGNKYHLTSADYGHTVWVRVLITKTGYTSVGKNSARIDYSLIPDDVVGVAAEPAFQVGATASAREPDYTLRGAPVTPDFRFQWYSNGVAITGATHEDYVIPSAQYGKKLTVRVTPVLPGAIGKPATSASSATVTKGILYDSGAGLIDGPSQVGSVQTLVNPTFAYFDGTPTPVTVSGIQWMRDGVAIAGATKQTYTPVVADLDHVVSVKLTVSKTNFVSRTITIAGTQILPGDLDGFPYFQVYPEAGHVLNSHVQLDSVSTPGVTWSYEWLRDDVTIPGANGPTYQMVDADKDALLKFKVTVSKPGYTSIVYDEPFGKNYRIRFHAGYPVISDTTPVVGQQIQPELHTEINGFPVVPGVGSVDTTWYADGEVVGTGFTYTVAPDDLGKVLTVKVLAHAGGAYFDSAEVTTPPTAVVVNP